MERRVLLAIFLSFVVLYMYQYFLAPPVVPPEDVAAVPSPVETPVPATPLEPTPEEPPPAPAVPTEVEPGADLERVRSAASAREVEIETSRVIATFSNRGAVLTSWKLKDYLDPSGQLHDLVPQAVPEGTTKPFTLRLADAGATARLGQALFEVVQSNDRLRFEYEERGGARAYKEFRFADDSYELAVDIGVSLAGQPVPAVWQWGPGLGPVHVVNRSRFTQASEGILYATGSTERVAGGVSERLDAGDLERLATDDADDLPVFTGPMGFAGLDDQYFLSALIRPAAQTIAFAPFRTPVPDDDEAEAELVAYEVQVTSDAGPQRLFLGPKDFDLLRNTDPDLVRAINFGWFAWIVVPLLTSLKWLHGYLGNYGWSLIVLTLLINAVMFPLRHKSVVSMRKMSAIQPEIKAIQARYAKLKATDPDKQKMNTEMMALYREKGVNPASGCVPLLLTFPVLFAFYRLLSVAIEIRGAPFALWITDLSAPDPLYITPLVMGATMFIQQRMTVNPGTMDPMQQKLMTYLMPVMFTGFSLYFPSGLVLYWIVSNGWNIGQQAITNRIIGPPPSHAVRAPAERQVKAKRAGKGKTRGAEKPS